MKTPSAGRCWGRWRRCGPRWPRRASARQSWTNCDRTLQLEITMSQSTVGSPVRSSSSYGPLDAKAIAKAARIERRKRVAKWLFRLAAGFSLPLLLLTGFWVYLRFTYFENIIAPVDASAVV